MHQRKFLVTGATGYIGSNFVELLIKNNCEVLVLIRDPLKLQKFSWHKKVAFIECDYHTSIPNIKDLDSYYMVHFAWNNVSNFTDPFHLVDNLPSNYNFLSKMIQNGLKKLCVIGTCFEYGLYNGIIPSDTIPNPVTYYGLAKHALHQSLLLLKLSNDFELLWLRPFYIYGKNHSPRSLFGLLDDAKKRNLAQFNMSNGDQLRDYLHISDAVSQIYKLLLSKPFGQYNICSEKPISVKDLVIKYMEENNISIELNTGYYDYPAYESKNFWGKKS
jgi:dTDP-6-deoxy-L-talose 4-dehydrogenase (NAD+)